MSKFTGDLESAFDVLDTVCQKKCFAKITCHDKQEHRYGITLHSLFTKVYACEETLEATIKKAVNRFLEKEKERTNRTKETTQET